jgi:hypothetical protein
VLDECRFRKALSRRVEHVHVWLLLQPADTRHDDLSPFLQSPVKIDDCGRASHDFHAFDWAAEHHKGTKEADKR